MTTVQLSGTSARGMLTYHGKQSIALLMIDRGKECFVAGHDLREGKRNGYVWRYLICQAAELVLKGCLQLKDFDKYDNDTLKDDFRHRLVKLAKECSAAYGVRAPEGALLAELESLSKLYEQHDLRYASKMDIFTDPSSIPALMVSDRLEAVIRLVIRAHRNGTLPLGPPSNASKAP